MSIVPAQPHLVGDIGGTNARFALADTDGQIYAEQVLAVADYPDIVAAITAYLHSLAEPNPTHAALAIALPILGDQVTMTNNERWSFSIEATRRVLGLERLVLLNDFTALALAVPHLRADEVRQVGGGTAVAGEAIGLIGPGTGCGVSGLVPAQGHWTPLHSEGGHATVAPMNALEWDIAHRLQQRYGHASWERLLSGPGLLNLYQILAERAAVVPQALTPKQITDQALGGECPLCGQAMELFCAVLGTAAANLAVTLGALGGVYIGGGIVPRLGTWFEHSTFRSRFETKGRFSAYLAAIPTYVITAKHPALRGAAAAIAV